MKIGISAWVWIAPVTTSSFVELVPKIAQMGFDWIEVPIDGIHDLDYEYAGKVIAEHGLGCNVCVVIGPDRDLIHPDRSIRENAAAIALRQCVHSAEPAWAVHSIRLLGDSGSSQRRNVRGISTC